MMQKPITKRLMVMILKNFYKFGERGESSGERKNTVLSP